MGREFGNNTDVRFIGEGLQGDFGIALDFLTFCFTSKDSLFVRLVHEILHVLGVEEEEMHCYILPACDEVYATAEPLLITLLSSTAAVSSEFAKTVNNMSIECVDLYKKLFEIGMDMFQHGFPVKPDSILLAKNFFPEKLFPKCEFKDYDILFM